MPILIDGPNGKIVYTGYPVLAGSETKEETGVGLSLVGSTAYKATSSWTVNGDRTGYAYSIAISADPGGSITTLTNTSPDAEKVASQVNMILTSTVTYSASTDKTTFKVQVDATAYFKPPFNLDLNYTTKSQATEADVIFKGTMAFDGGLIIEAL